jgi:HEPN domain-containing protein
MSLQAENAKIEYVKKWIEKADNDLTIARDERFLKNENIITDGICFHCQQTVEKYLKAFLAFHEIEFGKTHNLESLAVQCAEVDEEFKNLSFGELSEYGVSIRYPDDFYMPNIEEADISFLSEKSSFLTSYRRRPVSSCRKQPKNLDSGLRRNDGCQKQGFSDSHYFNCYCRENPGFYPVQA